MLRDFRPFKQAAVLLPLVLAVAASSCTPQTRYKVLNFLLDGVPPPEDLKKDSSILNPEGAGAVNVSTAAAQNTMPEPGTAYTLMTRDLAPTDIVHPPFKFKLCTFCHDFGSGSDRLRYPLPDVCFQCHGRLDQMGKTVHWPVRQGRCATCHNPHQAPNARLLRMSVPRLCFQCHNGNKLPHGPDIGYCLDCHNPHSSPNPHLLKQ